jgi:hypothetical protein
MLREGSVQRRVDHGEPAGGFRHLADDSDCRELVHARPGEPVAQESSAALMIALRFWRSASAPV